MVKQKLFKAVALVFALIIACGTLAVGCTSECKHEFSDGKCILCDYECPHDEYENEHCTVCNMQCKHAVYNGGICASCGKVCEHKQYEDGICKECGTECDHDFLNGICKKCKAECKHNFVNGSCIKCGLEDYSEPVRTPVYDYVPHIDAQLPRIDITSSTLMNDATRNVPSFDNNNAANNIDWQYHDSRIKVSNCDDKFALSDIKAGVKIRGNWTTTYPKKPFRIKFDKKQAMLGLNDGAKFKSWVLLADYKDISLERNSLAFFLGNKIMGSDGYYSSDCRQVELYLNNQYWGVYLLAEQQQVNSGRVNVNEPEDGYTGTDIGYMFEYDGYYNLEVYNERFTVDYSKLGGLKTREGRTVYPSQNGFAIKNDVYDEAQKQFIKSYMNNLYKICYEAVYNRKYYTFNSTYTGLVAYSPKTISPVQETVAKVIDIQSLVDMYIHSEIACDFDIGWSSFFMDVDMSADGDKMLRFEAPWDFDSAFGLRYACESGEGLFAADSSNPWLIIFINEDWFWNRVKDKWSEIKENNVQKDALQYLNTLKTNFSSSAYKRNFDKWGFVKSGECTSEIQNNVHNHSQAVTQLYNWLNKRFNYLNSVWL